MPWNTLKETFEPLLPALLLALFGSVANFCMEKKHSLRELVSGLIVSFFAGAIASLLLVDAPCSPHTKIALGGMAGFMGSWFLNLLSRRLGKVVETAPLPTGKED